MHTLDAKIADSGYTTTDIAHLAGVGIPAVCNYRARRYEKVGRATGRKIETVLIELGIKKQKSPRARAKATLHRFHSEARSFGVSLAERDKALHDEIFVQIMGVPG